MRTRKPVFLYQRPALGLTLMLALLAMVMGCGRKAPPVWIEPTQLPAVSSLTALYEGGDITLSWQYPDEMMPYTRAFRVEMFREGSLISSSMTRDRRFRTTGAVGSSFRVTAIAKRKGVVAGTSPVLGPPFLEGLDAPTGLRADMTLEGLLLKWEAVEGASAYNVYRWLNKKGPAPVEPAGEHLEGLEFIDRDPLAGEGDVMTYTVRAMGIFNAEGARSVVSGASSAPLEVNADIFRPAAPTGVDITESGGKVLVYWDVSPEKWVEGYRVYRVEGKGKLSPIAKTVTPAYSEIPPGNTGVGYAVSAYGRSLEGPLSATVRLKSPSSR